MTSKKSSAGIKKNTSIAELSQLQKKKHGFHISNNKRNAYFDEIVISLRISRLEDNSSVLEGKAFWRSI